MAVEQVGDPGTTGNFEVTCAGQLIHSKTTRGQGKCQTASACAWDHSNATCAYTGVNATTDDAADDGDDAAAVEALFAARSSPAAGAAGRARRWASSALAYSGMGRR